MDRRMFLSTALLAELALAAEKRTATRIYVGDTTPYSFTGPDGAPTGAAYEMVAEIARELSLTLDPLVAPLVRAFKEAETKGPALIIPPARIPSREKLLRWVAPLVPVRLMLFAKQGSSHDISSIESASKLEVGILSAPGLDETYRGAGFQKTRLLPSNEAAIRMLLNDRVPAVLTADCSVYAAMKTAGIPGSQIREGAVLSAVTLWLAASKDFPDQELRQWQAAAEKRRPQLDRILAKYI